MMPAQMPTDSPTSLDALLRCPVTGQPLVPDASGFVTADGTRRYPLSPGGVPMFAGEDLSAASASQRAHYDHIQTLYVENLAQPYTQEYTQALDDVFRDELARLEGAPDASLGAIAEICCGTGEALHMLRGRFSAGIGVDVSVRMLESARATFKPSDRVMFVQGDALRLPIASDSLDHAFIFGGVHHVPDRDGLFREAFRVLRPGGRLYFREPVSDFVLWRALRAVVYRLSPMLDHENERPLLYDETAPPLERAGFTVESWRTCGFLGFCLFMNSDVLVFNRALRYLPKIRELTRAAARFDDWCIALPGLARSGLQVVGAARKPL